MLSDDTQDVTMATIAKYRKSWKIPENRGKIGKIRKNREKSLIREQGWEAVCTTYIECVSMPIIALSSRLCQEPESFSLNSRHSR